MGFGKIGPQADRIAQGVLGLDIVLQGQEHAAQVVPGVGVIAVEPDHLVEGLGRGLGLPLGLQDAAQAEVRFGGARLGLDGGAKLLGGGRQPVGPLVEHAEGQQRAHVVRVQAERLAIAFFGGGHVAQVALKATQLDERR